MSRDEWLAARKSFAGKEVEHHRAAEKLTSELRDLPMVKIEKDYTFEAPSGQRVGLKDLFDGKSQLIVYHFMFLPSWKQGCRGCSFLGDHVPDPRNLAIKDVAFCAVSPAPQSKIQPFREKCGWVFPWYSSGENDFAKDLNQSHNQPGASVFLIKDGEVFQTYSLQHEGLERVLTTFQYLDLTPLGRQSDGDCGPDEFKRGFEYDSETAHVDREGFGLVS